MPQRRQVLLFFFLLVFILSWLGTPASLQAFPLRIGEDCFYGEGEPSGEGISTWMGYAIRFEPPYTPYTVDGVSIYINQLLLASSADRRLRVSILDEVGIRRQYCDINWRELKGHPGWVLIDLANREYSGPFTIIVHSGIGLNPTINFPIEAVFRLGVDTTESSSHSYVYTSHSPPSPPPNGPFAENEILKLAEATMAKLAPASTGTSDFHGGDWMIRAHSPGLQTESRRIVITMEDIEALYNPPQIPSPEWHLPPIEGFGPRGMVHCPTSFAGITYFYHEEDRGRKFLTPHDGPWAHPDLVATLGALSVELAAEGVVGVEHIGIYNDRNIHGTNIKSSHSYGLGIDLTGFQYTDGRIYLVEDHDDPDVRAVLEHIRDNYLKKYFTTVLDWNYQRHDNHFHVNLPYPH